MPKKYIDLIKEDVFQVDSGNRTLEESDKLGERLLWEEYEVQDILERIERQEDITCVLQTIKHIRNDYNIKKER